MEYMTLPCFLVFFKEGKSKLGSTGKENKKNRNPLKKMQLCAFVAL